MTEPSQTQHPTAVRADRAARLLHLKWSDGSTSSIPFEALRRACPCAFCQGEMGQPGYRAEGDQLSDAETDLVQVQSVGRYALQFAWGDGHSTGIYTYELLRALTP